MKQVFDDYCTKYDAWYDTHAYAYMSELRALKKVMPARGPGVEIGVGTGRFAAPLGIRFGIDPSRKMLAAARKRGVDVRFGIGENIPFPDGTFAYAAVIITLCFVKDPQKVLEEAARVLRKNGRIIIGIVDRESFLGRMYRRKRSVFYHRAHFFSPKEIAQMLTKAGFRKISFYQTLFTYPERMTKVTRPRAGFGKGGFVVIAGEKGGEIK